MFVGINNQSPTSDPPPYLSSPRGPGEPQLLLLLPRHPPIPKVPYQYRDPVIIEGRCCVLYDPNTVGEEEESEDPWAGGENGDG